MPGARDLRHPDPHGRELRAALPPAVAAQLDLSSLQPLPIRFADANLDSAASDLLFSACLAGRKALLYILIEHQSTPDRVIPLRLPRYIGRILDPAHCSRSSAHGTRPDLLPEVTQMAEHFSCRRRLRPGASRAGEARGEAKGEARDKAIGLVEGHARSLRKLMQRKFGPLPLTRKR